MMFLVYVLDLEEGNGALHFALFPLSQAAWRMALQELASNFQCGFQMNSLVDVGGSVVAVVGGRGS